ncbi:hypothetical protein ACSBR1_036009 [Camellia fascicularis]
MKRLQQPVSSAAKKQTLQWAAWTRQEEESSFTALRQVGKAFFADMGGNVGHLHKLLGIESSSQLDHLIHPKLPSFPVPETGAYGLTSYWKRLAYVFIKFTRVICLPLCNRNLHGFVTSGTVQHRYDLLTFVRQQGISILSAIVAIDSYRDCYLHIVFAELSSTEPLGTTISDRSKQVSGPSSPEFKRGFSIGIGTILRRAASVASVAAKHAYAAAASTQGSNEEMLPWKCCLMSVSLPWEHIAYDLLFKVG